MTATRPPIDPATIERLLSLAMARGAEFADVYAERTERTGLSLEEGRIRSSQFGIDQGVGIRAISGAKVGYAYSDDLDPTSLEQAARTAAHIAAAPREAPPTRLRRIATPVHYRVLEPLAKAAIDRKVELVQRGDRAARAFDSRITQVFGSYADQTRSIAVGNTDGHFAEDVQDLCRLHFQVVAATKRGERRTGFYGGGGRVDIRYFDAFTPEAAAREAARQAIATLGAIDAPAGPQTVVLAPGWSGILLHEAIGHGLEADFIRKGTSLFTGKVGQKVASDLVTVIDDGTVANARGSLNVDDEGVPAERKVLIESGVLRGYMSDRLNGKLLGARSTGSGRRESFRHPPMPRMTNTFLAPGDETPEEILRGVSRGLYCAQFGGGQVDISNGNFVFEVAEAYLIEDGKLGRPVKNATLIGVGPEVLARVSHVGCDPTPDPGIGTCGKDGQMVQVGVGLPTVRIEELTVGGTAVGAGA
ncbi:MAG TPA: metallopeptidase TldD-related protein [Myxococcales bacterium]|nr:metallopeptidase TldD-related protein [Myxococcales bacterium]